MKILIVGMFFLIFTMVNFTQTKINVPFEMKRGETVEIEGLKIKYLGGNREWATGQDKQGKMFEIFYLRYKFEVTNNGKTETFQVVSPQKIGDLVLQVLSPQRVEFNQTDEVCKLVVMTSQQFAEKEKQAEAELMDVGKLSMVVLFATEKIGEGGETSEGETLTRKILSRENAEIAFNSILKNGTSEAKLYALWALRKLYGRASHKYFEPFRNSTDKVKRMSGCESFSETFSQTVTEIENPFYLKMKSKELWTMDLERRRAMLTDEEEKFLLAIFRIYKSSNELSKIADAPFGELFQREAEKILGN